MLEGNVVLATHALTIQFSDFFFEGSNFSRAVVAGLHRNEFRSELKSAPEMPGNPIRGSNIECDSALPP